MRDGFQYRTVRGAFGCALEWAIYLKIQLRLIDADELPFPGRTAVLPPDEDEGFAEAIDFFHDEFANRTALSADFYGRPCRPFASRDPAAARGLIWTVRKRTAEMPLALLRPPCFDRGPIGPRNRPRARFGLLPSCVAGLFSKNAWYADAPAVRVARARPAKKGPANPTMAAPSAYLRNSMSEIDIKHVPNVAAILRNARGRILVCERLGVAGAWQFPQGGIDDGETPEQALARSFGRRSASARRIFA